MKIHQSNLAGWFFQVVQVGIALMLLVSAHFHFSNPVAFLESVLQYRIINGWFAVWIAAIVPSMQVIISGVLLVTPQQRLGSALAAGLLVLFFSAQLYAWLGGLAIDCGCFGPYSSRISLYSVCFVGALAAAAVALALRPPQIVRRPLDRGAALSGY